MKHLKDILTEGILGDIDDTLINGDKIVKHADIALNVECKDFNAVHKALSMFIGTKLKISKSSAKLKCRNGYGLFSREYIQLTGAKMIKFDIKFDKGAINGGIFRFVLQGDNLMCQYSELYPYRDVVDKKTGEIKTEYSAHVVGFVDNYPWGTSLFDWLCTSIEIEKALNLLNK